MNWKFIISATIQSTLTFVVYAVMVLAGAEMENSFTFAYACVIGAVAAYLVEKYLIGLE